MSTSGSSYFKFNGETDNANFNKVSQSAGSHLPRTSQNDNSRGNQLIELNDERNKTMQYQLQVEQEKNTYIQQLSDQAEAIQNLERDINDVNHIYKSLGRLVHDQGETIDSIEANIETTHVSVRQATSELKKASNYMSKVRKKRFILAVVVALILLLIILYIYFSIKSS